MADFSGAPTSGPAPLRVNFTDLSLGGPTCWEWEFGDGGTSAQRDPSHTYSKAGTYTVSLTAAYAEGPDTETKLGYIRARFPDVAQGHWACQEILACVDGAIAAGYDDGCYRGDAPVTRDQMAVYLARALAGGDAGVPEASPPATFEDVPQDHWACKYVEYAVEQEVVQGYDATSYAPEVEVDRAQMAVFVARAKGWVGLADDMATAPQLFPDVPAAFWSGTAIEACVDNGVVQGYQDGHYYPGNVVTRDQMAVYVARAFALI
jgi:PKD repeat protein